MKNKIIKHYGATLLCCLCIAVVAGNSTDINSRIAKLSEDLYKQLENSNLDLYNDTMIDEHRRNLTELNIKIVKLRDDAYKELVDDMPNFNLSHIDIINAYGHEHSNRNSFSVRKVLIGILVAIKVMLLLIRFCVYLGNNENDDLNDTASHHDKVVYCSYPFLFVMILLSVAITILLIFNKFI